MKMEGHAVARLQDAINTLTGTIDHTIVPRLVDLPLKIDAAKADHEKFTEAIKEITATNEILQNTVDSARKLLMEKDVQCIRLKQQLKHLLKNNKILEHKIMEQEIAPTHETSSHSYIRRVRLDIFQKALQLHLHAHTKHHFKGVIFNDEEELTYIDVNNRGGRGEVRNQIWQELANCSSHMDAWKQLLLGGQPLTAQPPLSASICMDNTLQIETSSP